ERIHAVAIDQRVGRSGVDHQRAWPIVYGNRNEQMITVASFQLCTGKSLFRKCASERAAGLLAFCEKRDQRSDEDDGHEPFVHGRLVEQSLRLVEPYCEPGSTGGQFTLG